MDGIYMAPLPPVEIKKPNPPLKTEEIFPIIIRYGLLLFFYVTTFAYFFNDSMQFILFIGVFILNFFLLVFLYKDFFSNEKLSQVIFNPNMVFSFGELNGGFVKLFIGVIFLVLLMQIASIAIILVVFDYGKANTNNYLSYTMTPPNMIILRLFKEILMWTTLCIAIFAFILIYSFTENRAKALLLNTIGAILSFTVIVTGAYGIYVSKQFLDIKEHGQQLYQ